MMEAVESMKSVITVHVLDWSDAAAQAMPLRERVFVIEQGVPAELERDAKDPACRHALALAADGDVIGTGRLLPDGHIGRMAVSAQWRNCGVGGLMLEALVVEAIRLGFAEVILNAQIAARDFYLRHGFKAEGDVFIEAGIEHQMMRRKLAA
jgi:predicted GNAT family N-acyltransferase